MAFRRHSVRVEDPHPCSLAAGVLLERRLREAELSDWFSFRAEFLAKKRAELGDLVCHYCGKPGLKDTVNDGESESGLATIDHVVPRSKGGAERDEANLAVS